MVGQFNNNLLKLYNKITPFVKNLLLSLDSYFNVDFESLVLFYVVRLF